MIKGLNNISNIIAGTVPISKVMLGPNLIWEKLGDVVGTLLERFIDRVTNDGGTYVENEMSTEIVEEPGVTLLMTPNAYKAGKLYSAIPEDGSGDFIVDGGGAPNIENDLVEVGQEDNYGENLYAYNSTMGGNTWNWSGYTTFTAVNNSNPPQGINYVWSFTNAANRTYHSSSYGFPGNVYVRVYTTSNNATTLTSYHGSYTPTNYTIIDVGNGWYEHKAFFSNLTQGLGLSNAGYIAGFQYSSTEAGLDSIIETTGTTKPYGNHPIPIYEPINSRVVVESGIPNLTDITRFVQNGLTLTYTTNYTRPFAGNYVEFVRPSSGAINATIVYDFDPTKIYTLIYFTRSTVSFNLIGTAAFSQSSTSYTQFGTYTTTNVGGGWFQFTHVGQVPSHSHNWLVIRGQYNTTHYLGGVMIIEGDHSTLTPADVVGMNEIVIPGDILTTTPPTGTIELTTTLDGTETSTFDIPATYQLPVGNVNKVVGYNYPKDIKSYYEYRVPQDGGTYIDGEIINEGQKLLLTPNGYKTGKLYSALPWDGSGDFNYSDSTIEPVIGDGFITTNVPSTIDVTGENLYAYNSTMTGNSWYYGGYINWTQNTEVTPPEGITYVWETTSGNVTHTNSRGFPEGNNWIKMYLTTDVVGTLDSFHGSYDLDNYTVTDVGNGWYKHKAFVYGSRNGVQFNALGLLVAGYQISATEEGLDNNIETTGSTKPYGTYSVPTTTYLNITTTTPADVNRIYETVNGVETKITTIPTIYQLPEGNVNKVEMYGGPHTIKWDGITEGDKLYNGDPILLKVKIK